MQTVEQFIELCQEMVRQVEGGQLGLNQAAAKINNNIYRYPFKGQAHPMVYQIANLAFDIAEDYRTKNEDKTSWHQLIDTLQRYLSGNWESTCWMLSAMYGEYQDNKLTQSFSVAAKRQNGQTVVESATDELKRALTQPIAKINIAQTDQRYLQNLALFLPPQVNQLTLISHHITEYLTEPYGTTNPAAK